MLDGERRMYCHILLVKCDVLKVLGKKFDIHLKKKSTSTPWPSISSPGNVAHRGESSTLRDMCSRRFAAAPFRGKKQEKREGASTEYLIIYDASHTKDISAINKNKLQLNWIIWSEFP